MQFGNDNLHKVWKIKNKKTKKRTMNEYDEEEGKKTP